MNDYVLSLIRTWVPLGVGAVAAWLAARNINLSAEETAGGVAFVTAVLGGAYYAVVHALEKKFPAVGRVFLGLGAKGRPAYVDKASREWKA